MDKSKLHILAVSGILKKDGKYLILKRSENEIAYPGKWTVPGGKVEGEDDIKKTLKREFREEAGIKISDKLIFFKESGFVRPDGYRVIVFRFLCEYEKGSVRIDEKDFTDYAWVGPEELNKYDLIEGVKKDLEEIENIDKKSA